MNPSLSSQAIGDHIPNKVIVKSEIILEQNQLGRLQMDESFPLLSCYWVTGDRYQTKGSAVFKRRLNFVPLPDPEPLHTNYRDPLPETILLLHPC